MKFFTAAAVLSSLLPVLVNGHPHLQGRSAVSGSLVGSDGKATCLDYVANSGADWLMAALCAISKCNSKWPLSLLNITADVVTNVGEVTVSLYNTDKNMEVHTTSVSYADASASGLDNAGGAAGVQNGALINGTEVTQTYQQLGAIALSMLTGIEASQQTIPNTDDELWAIIQGHASSSPIIIFTESTDQGLGQYYSVNTFTDDKVITLWNPKPDSSGNANYVQKGLTELRKGTAYYYSLKDFGSFSG